LVPHSSYSLLRKELEAGTLTCRQVVEYYLQQANAHSDLNAFLELYPDEALAAADQQDKLLSEGKAGRLAGMVIALKDVICYKDHGVSSSSRILSGFRSLYNATVTERLLAEGAIIIGRTNCDEFAMGASNENSAYGPVKNAADQARVPGGSSGGSAVAVQAGLCHAALGSDTGGSLGFAGLRKQLRPDRTHDAQRGRHCTAAGGDGRARCLRRHLFPKTC